MRPGGESGWWLWRRLIGLIGLSVPRRLRADWRQEWEAELRYREMLLSRWEQLDRRSRFALLRSSLGAMLDAVAIQPRRLEDEMFQDLRYGLRLLWQHRNFALATIFTLALGIGASTLLFSVMDAALFRPLPFAESERLVKIERANWLYQIFPPKEAGFFSPREPVDIFEQVAAYESGNVSLTDDETPVRISAMRVTSGFFPMLGVNPLLGRTPTAEEERLGRHRVVVLGYGLWRSRFGGDVGVIDKSVRLNGRRFTIIGVMPRDFRFAHFGRRAELWAPLSPGEDLFAAEAIFYEVSGRLRRGLTYGQAQAQVDAIYDRVWQRDPDNKPEQKQQNRIELKPLREQFTGDLRSPLLILMGAVGCVLLLACVNAANLLLARSVARGKEAAIRAALGATRLRLMRQWLTESTILGVLGGAVGVLLAIWGIRLLLAVNPFAAQLIHDVEINARVLGFALAASLLTGWMFGLVPSWQFSKPDLNPALKDGGYRGAANLSPGLRRGLIVLEVALSLVLLAGAGLLIKSFLNVLAIPPGFNPRGVLTLELAPSQAKYADQESRGRFYRQILERVKTLPGVEAAGLTSHLPIVPGGFMIVPVEASDGGESMGKFSSGALRIASADYFRAMQIPLLSGRTFNDGDSAGAQPVLVLNQRLARSIFGDINPIGRRITLFRRPDTSYEVVGVIGDIRTRHLEWAQDSELYLHAAQRPPAFAQLAVYTPGDPACLTPSLRQAIREIDAEHPVHNVKTMEQHISDSLAERRLAMSLLSVFAAIALLLAAVGIYGVIGYAVAQRTHEIGVRMAIGATSGDILRMVAGEGAKLIVGGLVLGLVSAYGLTRYLSGLLYEVQPNDPETLFGSALLLAGIALLACYLPARRAAKVDPLTALRRD